MKLIRIFFSCILIFNSCVSFHYTDYGKPFDFLKSQRLSFHKSDIPVNHIKSFSSAKLSLNEEDSNFKKIKKKTKVKIFDFEDKIKSVDELFTQSNFDDIHINNNTTNEFPEVSKKKKRLKELMINGINKKISKISNTTAYKKETPLTLKYDDVSDFALFLICLLIPPAAVWYFFGMPSSIKEIISIKEIVIDFFLWFPSYILLRPLFSGALARFILPFCISMAICYAIYVCFLS